MHSNIKSFILIILVLFSFNSILAKTQPDNAKTILKVFYLPDPRQTDAFTRADLAVIEAFKKKYPNIELRSFSGIQIEHMDYDAAPLMAIAGGVSPDVIYVNFRQSATYIENNFLYPLDEFIAKKSSTDFDLRVAKPVLPVINRSKNKNSEPKTWALPYETLVRVFMWRKDLFLKAGLDPEVPPKNWDELYDYAKMLTIPEIGQYGLQLAGGAQASYDWITYLWSAGGEAVKYNKNDDSWYAAFNSKAGVDAMLYYLKLITTKWYDSRQKPQRGVVIREGDWGSMWENGKIAMKMDYMNEKTLGGKLDANLYGTAPAPLGPSGKTGSELNCRMMGIFSKAGESNNAGLGNRNPAKVKQAAFDYIWFYDSEEARQIRIKTMIEAGYGKMQNPVYLKRYGYENYLKYTTKGWQQTFEQALKNGKPEPYGRNTQKIYEYMTYPIDDCIIKEDRGEFSTDINIKRQQIKKILDDAVNRTNKKMIGHISDKERKKRNRVAVFVAFFIFILFTVALVRIWKIFTPKNKYSSLSAGFKHANLAWLLLAPALGSIFLWKYVPMVMGSMMAFQDYSIVGDSEWIGLQNFADVLFDPVWWSALLKTLLYMSISLGLGFFPPIILAILLQEVSRGKIIYRVIYYLPAVISGVIVIYLWKLLYDPSDAGGLNQILLSLGLTKQRWLDDQALAMICVILPTVWAGIGPGSLIYLAALKGIPNDLYESADIDGAGFFSKIWHIVLPSLKALIIIQFIAAFIAAAQQSEFILVMTFGGPNEATKVADLLIFEKAYLYLKFGVATTMAWMLGMLLMGFTIFQLKKLSNMEFKTTGSDEEK